MIRVFVDSFTKVDNEFIDNINIQTLSFEKLLSNDDSLSKFVKVLDKYSNDKDKIIIISLLENKKLIKSVSNQLLVNENIKIINSFLPEKSFNLFIKEIIKNQDQSLDFIEEKLYKIMELFEIFSCVILEHTIL